MSAGLKQGIGAVLEIVGYATTEFYGIGYVLIALGAVLAADGARQAAHQAADRARAEQRRSNVQGNVRGSLQQHTLVFGQARVGGVICALGTANGPDMPNQDVFIGVAHSICHPGGCGGVPVNSTLWIDDTPVAIPADPVAAEVDITAAPYNGLVRLRHYTGTGTQGTDATLVGNGTDDATSYRRGVAWTWVRFRRPTSDETFRQAYRYGIPQFSVEMRGVNCYDPRLDSTNGGSGTQRYATPTTWTWTRNPALCAATYMIMAEMDGGWGRDPTTIDWVSVASAASTCEENITVPGGSRPRYTCDGVLLTSDKREANLQKILDCMAGRRIRIGAKYKFYAGVYRTPVTVIDDTWLAGAVKVTTRSPLESLYNAIRLNFNDSSQDYKSIEAPPILNSTYESQDGGYRVWRDLNLPLVANSYNAQYCGSILSANSRTQKIIELVLNLKGLDLETWETVTLNLPGLSQLSSLVFRVAGWELSKDGIRVTLQEENSANYTVPTFTVPTIGTAPSVGVETPGAPAGFNVFGVADGVVLQWLNPPGYVFERMQIERATASGGPFTIIGYVNNQTTSYTDSFTNGATYYYRIAARTKTGTLSAYTAVFSSTGKQAADSSAATILNALFEFGDTAWTKDAGWAIVLDASNAQSGSWEAQFTGTATGKLTNSRQVAVSAGDLVLAYGFIKNTTGATGNGYVRLSWLNSSLAEIGSSLSNIINATTYTQARAAATAPAGASFVVFQFQCDAPGAGKTWYADSAYMTVTPKSIDEIPDGPTYGRVANTGLTSNQVDLAKAGVLNRTQDNISDTATFVRLAASHASGNVAYNFRGVWSSTTAYVIGDEVVYQANYWLCLAANTNSAPSTGNTNWQVVGSYAAFLGAWSSTATYQPGAEVTYQGNFWVAVSQNTNSAPTTSNANWQIAGPSNLDNVSDGIYFQRKPVADSDSLLYNGKFGI